MATGQDSQRTTEKGPSKGETGIEKPSGAILAVRCHDVTVSLGNKQVGDFDQLVVLGMAVRLALHLRGVEAVAHETLRLVGLHLLHIPPTTLPLVVDMLAEVEFVKVAKEGKTIKAIIPTVPYYEDLFEGIGELAGTRDISEPEWLTLTMGIRAGTKNLCTIDVVKVLRAAAPTRTEASLRPSFHLSHD